MKKGLLAAVECYGYFITFLQNEQFDHDRMILEIVLTKFGSMGPKTQRNMHPRASNCHSSNSTSYILETHTVQVFSHGQQAENLKTAGAGCCAAYSTE